MGSVIMSSKMKSKAIMYAIVSAVLYALYPPIAKILIKTCPPAYLAAFLYLGTGIGTLIILLFNPNHSEYRGKKITKSDTSSLIAVTIFNVLASILMNVGVMFTSSSNIALLSNFEIVATASIALLIFHEKISKITGISIIIITVASFILSFENIGQFNLSFGSIAAILATICWGMENNFTKKLSDHDPIQIVMVKGFGVFLGSAILAVITREKLPDLKIIMYSLLLGFIAYGLSIVFYIIAQRYIGAAKTSAYYAVSPFISVLISFCIFKTTFSITFGFAFLLMAIGSILLTKGD